MARERHLEVRQALRDDGVLLAYFKQPGSVVLALLRTYGRHLVLIKPDRRAQTCSPVVPDPRWLGECAYPVMPQRLAAR
eukprot:2486368-Pyramimonas_sp.AAC.1